MKYVEEKNQDIILNKRQLQKQHCSYTKIEKGQNPIKMKNFLLEMNNQST